MLKRSKIAILAILVTIIVMAAPASAYITSQNIETKAERMVEIATNAQETVVDIVAFVTADTEAMNLIETAGLETDFYGNIALCVKDETTFGEWTAIEDGEGWTTLEDANAALEDDQYEDAIDYAKEALTVFRDAIRSIHVILCEAGVEIGQLLDPQILQEAIDRSQDRIDELGELLKDVDMLAVLDEAQGLLDDAQAYLDSENIDAAKDSLREANDLISQVCQDLKEIAQELNPQRIRDYCDEVGQYRDRFRDGFRGAWDEGVDVNGFLQTQGYQNEDDFMGRFQEMIDNAKGTEDIGDLEEIGRLIRQMDQSLTEEVGHYRASHGQEATGSDFGQEGSGSTYGQYGGGNTESGGSGQMGFGGGQ